MNYLPTAGRAFIQPEPHFVDTGIIEIPEKYKTKKKAVARVTAWTPGYRFRCDCGHVQHTKGSCRRCQRPRLKMISQEPTAPFAGDIVGLRVLYEESAVMGIAEDVFALPLDDIIAIIPDEVDLDGAGDDSGIKRCVFCGPCQEGSIQGMVMVKRSGRNVCPRCNRDENGTLITEL